MTKIDEILKHLYERKNYNRNNPCLAGEDQMCIEIVKAIIKSEDVKGE